jgi:hypothetical protein
MSGKTSSRFWTLYLIKQPSSLHRTLRLEFDLAAVIRASKASIVRLFVGHSRFKRLTDGRDRPKFGALFAVGAGDSV